jgi:hypothetical protein
MRLAALALILALSLASVAACGASSLATRRDRATVAAVAGFAAVAAGALLVASTDQDCERGSLFGGCIGGGNTLEGDLGSVLIIGGSGLAVGGMLGLGIPDKPAAPPRAPSGPTPPAPGPRVP